MAEFNKLLTPINTESLVQKVINKITDAIISGELKPGDKLPTEAEMVSAFKVGRNTIREAIRTLAAYGVVEIRRPEGTFICDGFSDIMFNPLLYSIILQKDSHKDLIGLRQLIESGVMRLIQERGISDEEFGELEKLFFDLAEKIRAENYDVAEIAEADMRLHKAFAYATNNSLVMLIHNAIAELTRESRYRTIRKIFEKNDKEYLIKTHRDLLDALREDAEISMEEAIQNSYFYWKDSYNW
jgi:GntR family transcriptional repressor for pyruvate dehydrogenase complex